MVSPQESVVEELPRANVKRIIKAKLAELNKSERDVQVQKEALQAFSESTRLFIHYLSATANDICKKHTISTEDVLLALEDLEFREFVEPLKACLEGFNEKKSSSKKAAPASAKRKSAPVANKGKKARQVVDAPAMRSIEEVVAVDDDEEDVDNETM